MTPFSSLIKKARTRRAMECIEIGRSCSTGIDEVRRCLRRAHPSGFATTWLVQNAVHFVERCSNPQAPSVNKKKPARGGLFLLMAEGQGFEPWVPLDTPVFKTGAFDHSATPPNEVGHYSDACFASKAKGPKN